MQEALNRTDLPVSLSLKGKRLVDVVAAISFLILLTPFFFLIAAWIKRTSHGTVFYHDRRVGKDGKEFTMYKFRTMYQGADQLKEKLKEYNEMSGPAFKMREDPRVTPIGRFLRRHSLDELPQLWNILKGEMSLVGPRPPLVEEVCHYQPWHWKRLSVTPGATCLWQVSGRNTIDNFDDWVRMDLEYIHRWSLWLDFKIILKTVWTVLRGTGC